MNPHILIVDDAEDQVEFMKIVFGLVDPTLVIASASSGDEALKMLTIDPKVCPRVILLDVRMPGKQGLDVLKELKSNPELKRIPVCMFSHGDVPLDVRNSYEFGASFYFKKPLGMEALKSFCGNFVQLWFNHALLSAE